MYRSLGWACATVFFTVTRLILVWREGQWLLFREAARNIYIGACVSVGGVDSGSGRLLVLMWLRGPRCTLIAAASCASACYIKHVVS